MCHVQSADNLLPGRPKASPDDSPRQANIDDGVKSDGAVESLPKTQGTPTDTAIVIPEDKDEHEDENEDENEDKDEEKDEEEEREDDGRLDAIRSPPLEDNVPGILEVRPGISSGDTPGEFDATISRQWLYGQVG